MLETELMLLKSPSLFAVDATNDPEFSLLRVGFC